MSHLHIVFNTMVKAIIKSKVYKYINKVVVSTTKDKKIIHYIAYCIKELGRNKYLDYFINCDNDIIKSQIADIGRPEDLNVLVNDENFSSMYSVLLNGRKKDINKYIKSSLHYPSIIETGINRYLDYFINDETLHINIAKQGRKCDLDILIHDKNESVRKAVASHGYDEHLDILEKENNPNINKIINELRGKREL